MKKALTCILILAAMPIFAQDAMTAETATEATDGLFDAEVPDRIEDLRWQKRVILVFADSPYDPNFIRQVEFLEDEPAALLDRDVVVFTDADPAANGPLRQAFHPRGFMMVLVGKDGQIKLRKPLPFDVREISRSIDKTELRQQELRERRRDGG